MSSIAVSPIAKPARRPARSADATGRPSARRFEGPAPARLTRRGRWALTVLFLGVVLLGAVMFGARSAATEHPGAPVPTRMVQVRPGDTLWGIASRIADPGQVRETVLQIEELNALPGAALQVGQRIAVPLR